jgi:hypothetical protein
MSAPQGTIYRAEAEAPLAQIVDELLRASSLSAGSCWWFGWHERAIVLPRALRRADELAGNWDALHVFAPNFELRELRQGRRTQRLLLSEITPPDKLAGWSAVGGPYLVEESLRLLAGGRLRLPEGQRRGVVATPRTLDYGLHEDLAHVEQTLVVDVLLYYDDEYRLQTVRYREPRYLEPGDVSASPGKIYAVAGTQDAKA